MAKKPNEAVVLANQFEGISSVLDFSKELDNIARGQNLYMSSMARGRLRRGSISTGMLTFDLILGGGIPPGRIFYTFGEKQTGKSTMVLQAVAEALKSNALAVLFDHESSFDPDYAERIGSGIPNTSHTYGFRNRKNQWEEPWRLMPLTPDTAEQTFKTMRAMLQALPSKFTASDDGVDRHFLVHPKYEIKRTDDIRVFQEGMQKKIGEQPCVVEVEDAGPQMVFVIDSLRSMVSEDLAEALDDEDKDGNKMAYLAKILGFWFPMVKTLLLRKQCILMCVNHMTINPMAGRYKNPESETGGSAVQFFPDIKVKMRLSQTKSNVTEEKHVSGDGLDSYLYGVMTVAKNKAGPSLKDVPYRVWKDEQGTPGRGIDPVFDTYTYLEMCGLLVKTSKDQFQFNVPEYKDRVFTWHDFKKLILVEEAESHLLRNYCRKMLLSGDAQNLFYEAQKNTSVKDKGKPATGKVSNYGPKEDDSVMGDGGDEDIEV